MSDTKKPQETLTDAVVCITSAAKLHLSMKKHSTEEVIVDALVWRYDISTWEARECTKSALSLLDLMPTSR